MKRLDKRDSRGLAIGFLGFVAILVVAALMYTMLDPAASMVFDMTASQADSQQAKNVINEREQIWNRLLFALLLIALFYLIARSVFESDTGV